MTANEKRLAVRDKYRIIIGRNKYSQPRRSYVNTKYKDGNYYSDCSSSVCWAYIAAGYPISGNSLLNTVGLYQSKNLVDVPVTIKSGRIANPEVLQVGDLLLFAGTDSSRKSAGYVGHVEMVGEISGSTVWLYGHGSGNPKRHEMNAYCKSRYGSKTSTALGNKGLIRVRRLIVDDAVVEGLSDAPRVTIANCKECNIRTGPGTQYESVGTAKCGERFPAAENPDGWVPVVYGGAARWVSGKYAGKVSGA